MTVTDDMGGPPDVPDPDEQALAAHHVQMWYVRDVDRLLALVFEAERLIGSPAPDQQEWVHDARQYLRDVRDLGVASDAGYLLAEHWRLLDLGGGRTSL